MNLLSALSNHKLFIYYCITIVILSLYSINSFIPTDMIYFGDDLSFHFQRLKALIEALKTGNFPAYIDYNTLETYGYGSKWFYSDFTLIPFGILGCFISLTTTYKIMIFALTFVCGIGTYIFVNKIIKNQQTAFLTGILYTFCLYRMYDIFLRAAIGEVIAFTLLPFIFWGFYEIIKGDYKKWYILSISFALLIYSHLISSVLVAATLVIFLFMNYKSVIEKPRRFIYLVVSAIVSLFLISYFLLPFIEQSLSDIFYFNKYRVFYLADYTTSLKGFFEVLTSKIIFKEESIYPSVGFILIIPQFLRIFIKNNHTTSLKYADIALVLGILYTVICLDIFPWHIFPFNRMNLVQFPYRFFLISSFFLAFSGAYYISVLVQDRKSKILAVLTIVTLTVLYNIYQESNVLKNREPFLFTHQDVGTGEYYPVSFSVEYMAEKKQRVDYKNTTTKIENLEKNGGVTSISVSALGSDTLEFPLLYYKGYSATFNNQNVPVLESIHGLIDVPIKGDGVVEITFTGTFLQKYSLYITLLSFVVLIAYIWRSRKKEKSQILKENIE